MFEVKKGVRKRGNKPDLKTLGELYQKYLTDEYTSAEIAEMYGVKAATVRSWFSKARKKEEAAKERELNG